MALSVDGHLGKDYIRDVDKQFIAEEVDGEGETQSAATHFYSPESRRTALPQV